MTEEQHLQAQFAMHAPPMPEWFERQFVKQEWPPLPLPDIVVPEWLQATLIKPKDQAVEGTPLEAFKARLQGPNSIDADDYYEPSSAAHKTLSEIINTYHKEVAARMDEQNRRFFEDQWALQNAWRVEYGRRMSQALLREWQARDAGPKKYTEDE